MSMLIGPVWLKASRTARSVISWNIDPPDPIAGQAERLLEVPGDRLALAVGVGRQVDQVGLGGLALQLADGVLLGRHDLVRGLVAVRDVQAEPALGAGRGHAPCWP